MQTQDMRLNDNWHADASATLAGQPAAFVTAPTWTIADTAIAEVTHLDAGSVGVTIRAKQIGSTTLTVAADGVTTEVTLNVLAPFDSIIVAFTKL